MSTRHIRSLRLPDECPSPEYLHALFYVDPDGDLRWRERPANAKDSKRWNTRFANQIAGCLDKGYRRVEIRMPGAAKGKLYAVHQVVWAMQTGSWAGKHLDHKDGDRGRCVVENLRPVSFEQNNQNRGKPRNNSSGHKGVSWEKQTGKWDAQIKCNGRRYRLGRFAKLEDAAAAYNAAADRLFGEFRRAA